MAALAALAATHYSEAPALVTAYSWFWQVEI
jgi:hypothetical protein